MAQPTPYTRQFDFSDFQTVNPARPLPGSELDAELDRVKLTSDQTLANLAKIQRDDGRLNNQSVTPESLSAATLALIAQGEYNPRGFWAAATAYAVGDLVEFNAATFLALVAHTSDTQFTTDQTAGRWLLIANGALQGGGQAIDLLEGDGTETVFNLSFTYNGDEAATVFVGGVAQIPGQDFTIVGDTLTFVSAPPAPVVPGRKNVMVRGTGLEAQLAADNATAAANNAANSATAAQNSATAASNSESAALASENAASASEAASATSEGNAATSASNAATSATNASNSAAAALASENAAAGSASAAATSATSAATSATTATNQATTATNQATAASNSASAAATSATNASNSASNASGSATVATQQATIATNAANAAGGSESNAAASASQAATSASNASASASSASSSASSANTSAVNAAASATSASNSATAAGNSAAAALASQNAAATSESNAAASATAANQSKIDTEQVAERYQGDKASAPTLRNNGSALQAGDLYFDTTLNEMRVYDGAVWKAAGSTVNGTAVRQTFTATAGQTTFAVTGGYDAGFADVYLNGVKLVNGVDVNVTSGTNVVLTVGAAAGDSVDVIAYGAFVLANHYTRAEADALLAGKVNKAGDTMMGQLNVSIASTTIPAIIASNSNDYDQIQIRQPNRNGNFGWSCSGVASEDYVVIDRQRNSVLEIHGKTNHIFRTNDLDRLKIDDAGRVTMSYQPMFTVVNPTSAPGAGSGYYFTNWTIIQNTGNHYNNSTGAFTAPVAGNYLFRMILMGVDNGNTTSPHCGFSLNGNSNTGGITGYASNAMWEHYNDARHKSDSMHILKLNAGDSVRTFTLYTGLSQPERTYFMGILLG